MKVAVISSKQC